MGSESKFVIFHLTVLRLGAMNMESQGMNLRIQNTPEEFKFEYAARRIITEAIRKAPLMGPDGETIELDDVTLEGEAMIHFRKNQKIPNFDYKISIPFRFRIASGELITGMIEIPEFTNYYGEVPEDLDVQVVFIRDWHCFAGTVQRILPQLRKTIPPALRSVLLTLPFALRQAGMAPPSIPKPAQLSISDMLQSEGPKQLE